MRLKLDHAACDVKGLAALDATDAAVCELAKEAYSPNSGAREVERVLRRCLDPGHHMLEAFPLEAPHPTRVRLGYDGQDFLFTREKLTLQAEAPYLQ